MDLRHGRRSDEIGVALRRDGKPDTTEGCWPPRSSNGRFANTTTHYNTARAAGYTVDSLDETVDSVVGTAMVDRVVEQFHGGVLTHLTSPDLANDGIALDPTKPDTAIYATDGVHYTLVGLMFLAPIGTHGPQPGGPLTVWHQHQGNCTEGTAPAPFRRYLPGDVLDAATGPCPRGTLGEWTPEIFHVWLDAPSPEAVFATDMAGADVQRALQSDRAVTRLGDGPDQIAVPR
ncbi:MAG: hypothetical protein NTX58_07920 [Actinobacteria bacterium]|nr:hypothetical protein [Actinomycetota bacterium]